MENSIGTSVDGDYEEHYNARDSSSTLAGQDQNSQIRLSRQQSTASGRHRPESNGDVDEIAIDVGRKQDVASVHNPDDYGLRRIIRSFTPGYASLLLRSSYSDSLTRSMYDQMLYDHHVYWRDIHYVAPTPLPFPLA